VPRPSDETTIGHRARSSDAAIAPDLDRFVGEHTDADNELQIGRFEVLRKLGAGGMGVVYEARDPDGGGRVALKSLRALTPSAAQRFKREFRALADVIHPNIVRLHELFATPREMYFTMERIEGVDFLQWVRAHGDWSRDGTTPGTVPDVHRLCRALAQLVSAVDAIHKHGKLHRDIKPSNVLVEQSGRVVVLDFGLVRDAEMPEAGMTISGAVMGTPAYMSPEQAGGEEVGPASDFYSIGVVLYQALTGRLPYADGTVSVPVLVAKRDRDPLPPSRLVEGLPSDLEALCLRLLSRTPADRPGAAEVLAALPQAEPTASAVEDAPQGEVPLVGRDAALKTLHDAYDSASLGHTVVVLVDGVSGVGKSALVEHFIRSLRRRASAVLLRGRCYERESVPFKAVDAVIDELARYLGKLPASEAAALMPRDIHALARLFPTLRGVDAIDTAPRRRTRESDDRELRRRGFDAFKELLGRITDRRPLVVHIDDLQWADDDSVALLLETVQPPEAPHMLLVAGFRREDAQASPVLDRLLAGLQGRKRAVDLRRIALEPLPPPQADALARSLLRHHGLDAASAPVIATECEGIPFFAGELVRHMAARTQDTPPRLDDALRERIARLPANARAVLETVALAGRRLPVPMALAAAPTTEGSDALAHLRSASFVRTLGARQHATVETYHDRIRTAVVAGLDDTARAKIHGALAEALEREPDPDPERLLVHYRGAGDHPRAGAFSVRAAERAAAKLAFDRAAELFALALELLRPSGREAGRLHRGRADALANAGRGHAAAQAYLLASDLCGDDERIDLRRRAAEHLLASGYGEEGRRVLHEVLTALDVQVPSTRAAVLRGLMWKRARIRLRGLSFTSRRAEDLDARMLALIDTCWTAGRGLIVTDIFEGAYFQAEHTLLSLQAGELHRVVAALAHEARSASFFGGRGLVRARELIARVDELARSSGSAEDRVHLEVAASLVETMGARWGDTLERAERAEELIRSECPTMAQELFDAQAHACVALMYLGRLRDLETRASAAAREAEASSDVYHGMMARYYLVSPVALASDDAEGAAELLAELDEQGERHRLQVAAVQSYTSRASLDLYAPGSDDPWARRMQDDARMKANPLWRATFPRLESTVFRARTALFLADADSGRRTEMLRHATRETRHVRRCALAVAGPQSRLLQAALHRARGDHEGAAAELRAAIEGFEDLQMALYAAVARLRLGELLGGDEGFTLRNRGTTAMRAEGVKDPERFAMIYGPGFAGPGVGP
jgi:eukaryotic-like serine/threonine-protein kinase